MQKGTRIATKVLDGVRISNRLRDKISYTVSAIYRESGKRPGIAVVHMGDTLEMERYVYAKKLLAHSLGIEFHEVHLPKSTDTKTLQSAIQELNRRRDINGVIVQLPLPQHLDSSVILNTIDPDKDVDGCNAFNQGQLYNSDFKTLINVPCAAPPSLHVYKIPTHRKRAVIIGNSALVGYPCFCMLQRMGCTCSMCHKDTVNVPSYTREADLVITAVGNPRMIKGAWLKPGATVIDIDELVGDADFESCLGVAGSLTPVPGGVALLTTAMLMKNTVQAMIRQEPGIRNYEMILEKSLFDSL
ncbi:hypothetical protein WA588_000765 [Blastocystis sp. NMH]